MISLIDDQLGELQLRSDPYVVVAFSIGARAPREVIRNRALADGVRDDTRYAGGRAATVALRLNDKACGTPVTMQSLYDRLLPYTLARRRPTLRWSLPGSDGEQRQMVVRGADAPVMIDSPKHPVISCSFVSDGEITSAGPEECTVINPALDVEQGRVYDRSGDRAYPASIAVGARNIFQGGNERAHWHGAIYGASTNPYISINGVRIDFLSNGGLLLPSGSSVVIDTRERTMFLNGDPASSRFDRTNFTDWQWEDLMLQPGNNVVRFGAATIGVGAQMNLCWKRTWAG